MFRALGHLGYEDWGFQGLRIGGSGLPFSSTGQGVSCSQLTKDLASWNSLRKDGSWLRFRVSALGFSSQLLTKNAEGSELQAVGSKPSKGFRA